MKTNKRIFLSAPHMSGNEITLVQEAFESNFIAPAGPMIDRFEKEFSQYVEIPYAVALSSGTAAIHLALRLSGVKAGKEVWCSSLTFIGNVAPVTYLSAQPVLFDVSPDSWNIDPDLLVEELERANQENRLPAAILPTDVFGQCCDMDAILEAADQYDIPVIFDAAESLGARYKGCHAGQGGKAAVFSFNGNKIISSSGGGMLVTADKELAEQARFLSQQARDNAPYYQHSTIGYNYRMSNIVAAIGLGQLQVIEDRVQRRRKIFSIYENILRDVPGLSFMPEAHYGKTTRWLTVIQLDNTIIDTDPEALRIALEKENIESRPVWKPMHMQPVFKNAKYVGGTVCEKLFANGLCLPSGTGLSDKDITFVAETVKSVLNRVNRT